MNSRSQLVFGCGLLGLLFAFLTNLSLGSVSIPFSDSLSILTGGESKSTWEYIVLNYRLPKSFTAILVGSGLSVSGLLMQTLFRNPLAGPYVLGISSGASLGVALLLMGGGVLGGFFLDFAALNWSLIVAASAGSFLVLLVVMATAAKIRDTMAILIIGLMFASLTSALVSVLSYFTSSEKLQQFVFWSYGSVGNLGWNELVVLVLFWLVGLGISFFCAKNLNALLLGENYAKSLGTPVKANRYWVILATSLLAGSVTAFAGPIAFIVLAIPHLVRLIFPSSNHLKLIPAVMIFGSILMLICDTVAQLPGSEITLPLNAITSLVGAPVVIWLLVRKKKLVF